MNSLLFIDDDVDLLLSNKRYFDKLGYDVQITDNAQTALDILSKNNPDCIILDVMMPSINGFDLIIKIKKISKSPVIFLSGRTEVQSKITGLMAGASDYLVKPYNIKELLARIEVQIRKNTDNLNIVKISYPPLSIDIATHKAYYKNTNEILLSNKEYDLLYTLVTSPNQVVLFEDIGKTVWGYYQEQDRKTIMVTAARLRKKLQDYAGLENIIENVRSKGYKFCIQKG